MAKDVVTVGRVEMVSLTDGQGDRAPTELFPQSAMELWRSQYPDLLDQAGRLHPRYGSVAVRSAGKLIIVDTGLQAPDGRLMEDMRRKGVDRNAVDLVVLTHLHPDHVGWNLSDGRPTFPGARYIVPRADWDYWTQPAVLERSPHVRQQVVPLQTLNVMDLVEDDHDVTKELKLIGTPGHTPGHVSLLISSAGERGCILGDVAHSPAQAQFTEWSPPFDLDHVVSRKTRQALFDRLEAEGATIIYGGHFPEPGFGRLVRLKGRRYWQVV